MAEFEFRFNEERNVAVFTVKQIFQENKPVLFVCHDEEDGAWQFLTGEAVEEKDSMIVALDEIVAHDQTLNEVFDLPEGYFAVREFIGDVWIREKRKS